MNRPIKFRAWDKNRKQMGTVTQWTINGAVYYSPSPDKADQLLTAIESELMQFTGLLDKNDKEIYEADWLKDQIGRLHKIVWSEREARFQALFFETEWQPRHIVDVKVMEVIGNIYENPELIK